MAACLAGTVVFHTKHIGLAHAHFNWLAGGPTQGWRYLSLSNVDWGQSTYRLAQWAREHPQLRPLTVLFVSELGAPAKLLADVDVQSSVQWLGSRTQGDELRPLPGWYAMSAEQLTHEQNEYFRQVSPQAWPYADVALFYVP